MKKILIAALVASTAAVAVESYAAAGDDGVRQLFAQLDRCLAAQDAKCVGGLLADDATYLAPTAGAKIVKGNAEIVKSLEDVPAAPASNTKTARTHAVQNVRMIGESLAVVDASVAGVKPAEDEAAASPGPYHSFAVVILKGDKWLFDDLRSYVVEPPKKPASSKD
jgi:uncharacterized protein (TIGR02246 family)